MMRKSWIALVVCALFAALPAAAGATLQQRVAKLEAKMDCLKRTPASTYIGYAYYEGNVGDPGPFPVHDPSTDLLLDASFAGAFDQLFGGPFNPDYWLAVVRDTSSCRSKFGLATNPYAPRPAAHEHSTASMQRFVRVR